MGNDAGGQTCKWCGTPLKIDTAEFCSVCYAPQTPFANFLYSANFLARNLAIPLTIGIVTWVLTSWQQEATIKIATREKLAEALGEVDKVQADFHRAYTQIAFMASQKSSDIPTKELKDAAIRVDSAIASFGAKLGPFEEFARREELYDIEKYGASPLQKVWDRCFVSAYWGSNGNPGILQKVKDKLVQCNDDLCEKKIAKDLQLLYEDFDLGDCEGGVPTKQLPQVWFNRELRKIAVEETRRENPYVMDGQ